MLSEARPTTDLLLLREQKAQRKKELIQERTKLRRAKAAYRADNAPLIRELQYRLSDLNVELDEKQQHLARIRGDECDETLLLKINDSETQLETISDATETVLDEYNEWQWRAGVLQAGLEEETSTRIGIETASPAAGGLAGGGSLALSKALEELRTLYKLKGQARGLREELESTKRARREELATT